ncbi:hypothetical protein J6590_024547 [Homalodisca vitripennis]|nr:hypothetical protein J6590_024547 [Homalodisca vitripennis]
MELNNVEKGIYLNVMFAGMLVPWMFSLWLLGAQSAKSPPRTPAKAAPGQGKFREVFSWNQIDFAFPTEEDRQAAIADESFIPENNLPLGIEVWKDRVFISVPRWKVGVPATLTVVSKNDLSPSPILNPYPSWAWHQSGNCNGLTSVFRMKADECGRLWVIDSGIIDALQTVKVICPPQLFVFDLATDRLLWKYEIPKSQNPESALFTFIAVDIRDHDCEDAHAYIADVFRYGLITYRWKTDDSWRITHPHFYPDPIVSRYSLDGLTFRWTDGIFGLSLSPVDPVTKDRTMYFHPMSSFREFEVATSILRREGGNLTQEEKDSFFLLGEPRGESNSHASASAMDREGILYYNLVTANSVGCWNSRTYFSQRSQGVVEKNSLTLNFPNDLKVDQEPQQNIWVLSNRLHKYLYSSLDPREVNFRLLTVSTKDAIKGTVCETGAKIPEIVEPKCPAKH